MSETTFQPRVVTIATAHIGEVKVLPPTFLERWGVVFLACGGGWILLVGTSLFLFYLWKQPPSANLSGLQGEALRDALAMHKEALDQWRDSLTFIFDLLVTRTVLPIVTLLLGYLFGKARPGEL